MLTMRENAAVASRLSTRSFVLLTRIPSTFIPSVVMPLFFVVAFSGAFSAIVNIPGFPTDNILNWMVPLAVVQGCAFAGATVALATARDLENGFYDRLLLSPAPRWTLLAGALQAALGRALLPLFVTTAAGFAGGARLTGPIGVIPLVVAALGVSVIAACWGLGVSYRVRSQQGSPLVQFGMFAAIFLSTAQVPLEVMTPWLQRVARLNPVTSILELARQGFLDGIVWDQTWPGLLALVLTTAFMGTFAARGLAKLIP